VALGGDKDNDEKRELFNRRRCPILLATTTFGEGADTIAVDALFELNLGASRSKTKQNDGRAMRNDPDEDGVPRKPTAMIFDLYFPGNKTLDRHSGIREGTHAETRCEILREHVI
jgi:superfamily II DNA or RNA helicase